MRETKNSGIKITDLFHYFMGHWYWFVLCVAICASIAYYRYSKTSHQYYGEATIIIKDPSQAQSTAQLNTYSTLINKVNMSNEILQLQSIDVMEDVVRTLDADVDYLIKDRMRWRNLYKEAPVRVFFPDRNDVGRLQFDWLIFPIDGGHIGIKKGESDMILVALGDTLSVNNCRLVFKPTQYFSDYINNPVRVVKHDTFSAVNSYRSRLKVIQTELDGAILHLSITDYSHFRAEDVLNTLVEKYNEDAIREKNRIAVNTGAFINERIYIIQNELGDVEDSLARFKKTEKIVDVESAASEYLAQSREFNADIVQIESKISSAQFMREYLASSFHAGMTVPVSSGMEDGQIDESINEYNKLVRERQRLVQGSSESSPAVKQMDISIHEYEDEIMRSVNSQISGLQAQKNRLLTQERESVRRFTVMPDKARELISIERQQQIKEQLYLFLLNKREENALTQAMVDNNARMIDAARSNWTPVYPNRKRMLLLAILIGLMIPAFILIAILLLDNNVQSRRDIEEATDMPILSTIPLEKSLKRKKVSGLIYGSADHQPFTEALRVLCTNLDYVRPEGCPHPVVLSTSFQASAGKTFLMQNIAACLADAGKKVILVDFDFRKRTLSAHYGLMHGALGFTNYIYDENADLSGVIRKDIIHGVDFIPAGHTPPNPSELLGRKRLDTCLKQLREIYDYVLLDGVPVNAVADVIVAQSVVDMNLVVIRAGKLDRRALRDLDKLYEENRLKCPGIILNGIDRKKSYGYGDGYGYGYSYGYSYKERRR